MAGNSSASAPWMSTGSPGGASSRQGLGSRWPSQHQDRVPAARTAASIQFSCSDRRSGPVRDRWREELGPAPRPPSAAAQDQAETPPAPPMRIEEAPGTTRWAPVLELNAWTQVNQIRGT